MSSYIDDWMANDCVMLLITMQYNPYMGLILYHIIWFSNITQASAVFPKHLHNCKFYITQVQ